MYVHRPVWAGSFLFIVIFCEFRVPEFIMVVDMFQRDSSRKHGAQRRAFSGGESGHVNVHGQEYGHESGTAKMQEKADLQQQRNVAPLRDEHEGQTGERQTDAARNGDNRHQFLPGVIETLRRQ